MGRLDDIIARNRESGRGKKLGMTAGIGMALFVFVVLVLLVFTDLGQSPPGGPPPGEPPPGPSTGSGERRVRGIGLYRETSRGVRDAGSD